MKSTSLPNWYVSRQPFLHLHEEQRAFLRARAAARAEAGAEIGAPDDAAVALVSCKLLDTLSELVVTAPCDVAPLLMA